MNAVSDVIVIGAGPAGLAAALWLGRCGRTTRVFDSGSPRNAASRALHGFLTRDGISPAELLAISRADLAGYPSVSLHDQKVVSAERIGEGFAVELTDGTRHGAHLLLLATGRTDHLPQIPDARRFFGRGLFHCAYCDGWEHRGQPMAVLGGTRSAVSIAKLLRTWTDDVTLCAQAPGDFDAAGFPVVTSPISHLRADAEGWLAELHFASGETRCCRALFFPSDCSQKSCLPEKLGCRFDAEGSVICEAHAATGVPGLFVAGNVRGGIHLALTAAAEGAEAALAMNDWLVERGQTRG